MIYFDPSLPVILSGNVQKRLSKLSFQQQRIERARGSSHVTPATAITHKQKTPPVLRWLALASSTFQFINFDRVLPFFIS